MSVLPLEGVRVLDLSRVLAGPWCTQLLADLGADVVKVERPGQGDDTRQWGPPWVEDEQGRHLTSAYYLCANRNKRSVALDLALEKDQQTLQALAARADVVVENFKLGGLKPYGLSPEQLRLAHPALVVCSITGFGQTGPMAASAGYDFLVQGMGGMMSLTGRPDSQAGGGPMKMGVALTDVMTGLYAAVGILAALRHKEATGQGQHIDMALLDVQVAALANQMASFLVSGEVPQRLGNAHPSIVPYQDFPSADGHLILAIGNDGQFKRFCEAAGVPQWAQDERFSSNPARVRHRWELCGMIAQLTRQHSTEHWVKRLQSVAVPCGPILDLQGVMAHAQVLARELRQGSSYEGVPVDLIRAPMLLDGQPLAARHPPPALGADAQEVLNDWLGTSA